MKRILLFVVLGISLVPGVVRAQDADEPFDLVFLRDNGPVLIRFHVRLDGQTIGQRFESYVKKWFDFVDRDGNGKLNAAELKLAPRAPTLLQIMRSGSLFIAPQGTLAMAELGKDDNAQIDFADFRDYYLKNNVQPFQTPAAAGFTQTNPVYDQISNALFQALDANHDGKLSREELKAGLKTLRKYDLDDDELVTPQELAPGTNPFVGRPFVVGGGPGKVDPQGGAFYYLHYANARERLGVLLLARYDKDKSTHLSREEGNFDAKVFAQLDRNQDGGLDVEELAAWSKTTPDVEFSISLKSGQPPIVELRRAAERLQTSTSKAADRMLLLSFAEAMIHISEMPAFANARFDQRQLFEQQFKFIDRNGRGYLTQEDVQGPNGRFLGSMFAPADRNGDGKLTLAELQAYGELAAEATRQQVSLSAQEQGRTLFQLLDANRDGRLSARELVTAWERLKGFDKDGDECITLSEIPRQHQIAFAQGSVQNYFVPANMNPFGPAQRISPPARAPVWFLKMDTNGDGDVSRREFLGSAEEFDRIDANHDGLIDAAEAERHDLAVRKKQ